jgi:uracil phosphoribosyltransferase
MFILAHHTSLANNFITELRDIQIQKDRMRFRKNLERLGEILAYEVSKSMDFKSIMVQTPLDTLETKVLSSQPVIVAVLRASLPFYQGFLNFFDQAESGFIGAFREEKGETIQVNLGYHASPDLNGKEVILADPMLATGKSILKSVDTLLTHGTPKQLHIAAAFAAPEGIEFIKSNLKIPFKLWIGALDEKLNSKSYIVPGLGDAGDLAFGEKL